MQPGFGGSCPPPGRGTLIVEASGSVVLAQVRGPAFLAVLNVHTGKVLWRERGFSKSTLVYADGKTIIL